MKAQLALVLCLVCAYVMASPLQVNVRIDKTQVVAGESLTAHVTVFNPSSADVTVLTWFTPLEGMRSDLFRIEHEETGRLAVYKGMIMKRVFPAPESAYVTIAAGEAKFIELSLSDNYHFMVDGAHRISLLSALHYFSSSSVVANASEFDGELEVSSEPHIVVVERANPASLVAAAAAASTSTNTLHPDAISYISCSSTQQSGIKSALPIAQSDATQAYNYLTSARYVLLVRFLSDARV
jgi:hypothetical protein